VPDVEITYCVVNTSQRELLLRGLDAIGRERTGVPFETEVLVLDNGSRDGSAQAARRHPAVDDVITLGERRGKAANDSELMARARGRYALLLNEDSELLPGATVALHDALERWAEAACAGARLVAPGWEATPGGGAFGCRGPWRCTTSSLRPGGAPSGGSWNSPGGGIGTCASITRPGAPSSCGG